MMSIFRKRKSEKSPKYSVGDFVRVSKTKTTFQKSFESGWSNEIFKISKILFRQGMYVCEVKD